MKTLLILTLCLSFFSYGQEPDIWKKRHKEIPIEIKAFFEERTWLAVVDSCIINDTSFNIEDFKIYKPDFYISPVFSNSINTTTSDIANAKGCLIHIQNYDSFGQYWFIRDTETRIWKFKEVKFSPCSVKPNVQGADSTVLFKNPFYIEGCPTCEKPIIYLYPLTPTDINVSLKFHESLIYTYPKYPKDGWNVKAFPDGMLVDQKNGSKYYSLFWEGAVYYSPSFETGFKVEADSVETFLEEKLAFLGLNYRERQEFIVYWAPRIKRNPYSLIHFSTDEYVKNFPLDVTPKPDSEIRINMVFKRCKSDTQIPVQSLVKGERDGFTLVEWGGIDLDRDNRIVQ